MPVDSSKVSDVHKRDPASVYFKGSTAWKELTQKISRTVLHVPQGQESNLKYRNVIIDCRDSAGKYPPEAFKHMYAICMSPVSHCDALQRG